MERQKNYDFDSTIDRVKAELQKGTIGIIDVLRMCGAFGDAKAKWHQVKKILKTAR